MIFESDLMLFLWLIRDHWLHLVVSIFWYIDMTILYQRKRPTLFLISKQFVEMDAIKIDYLSSAVFDWQGYNF